MRPAVVFTASALFYLLGTVPNNGFAVSRIVNAGAARILAARSWRRMSSIAKWCAIAKNSGGTNTPVTRKSAGKRTRSWWTETVKNSTFVTKSAAWRVLSGTTWFWT